MLMVCSSESRSTLKVFMGLGFVFYFVLPFSFRAVSRMKGKEISPSRKFPVSESRSF